MSAPVRHIASVISGKLAQRVGTKAIAVAGVTFLGLSGAVGVFATTMWKNVFVLILAGTGVGTRIAAGITAGATSSGGLPQHSAFATAFGVATIVAIVGLVVAVTIPKAEATDVQWSSSSSKSATPRFQ
ncbi:hypothetical protein QM716_09495 [Rhodococcus sp. IEGM 1409]|uniref:hypothetical protein n=1 Tax=Rhodococcus sp. IEGM 1409 TaxID=3047082 RepID=UPI0024B7B3C1|nr:hypothetical protein [Rhodococcus sp. IEGM 1409]MDI9900091.1 hypothetical protein [Rhodococcus sp. IEGM 1409]